MKTLILAIGLIAAPTQAEVIECPARHQGARLVGAGMYEGKQKEFELMGAPRRVPGGIDADFGFTRDDVMWLVCTYEKELVRWYRVGVEATSCKKETREQGKKVTVTVRCK